MLPGFSLTVRTAVPVARGLGSSAAALVAGLLAADHLLGLGLSSDEFYAHSWRMEGHGDNVGASLYGGAILAVPRIPYAIHSAMPPGSRNFADDGDLHSGNHRRDLGGKGGTAVPCAPARCCPEYRHGGRAGGGVPDEESRPACRRHARPASPALPGRLFPHLTPLTEAAVEAGAIGAVSERSRAVDPGAGRQGACRAGRARPDGRGGSGRCERGGGGSGAVGCRGSCRVGVARG